MVLPYNPEDKQSIVEFAKLLQGKTLKESCDPAILKHNYSGKGRFGQVLEKYYFLYEPNSDANPDFPIAGLELKSSPLEKKKQRYQSKERLVLNIINYLEIVNQEFETSAFWKKNASILFVFYLHEADLSLIDFVIKLVDLWDFPETDLEIIRKDWQIIKKKVKDGKAHELSEGDTLYLGACTKGATARTTRAQPFSNTPAKQRAYSLKQGYVNHIIASIANETSEVYGKLLTSPLQVREQSFESIVVSRFQPYFGKSIDEILKLKNLTINPKAKNFFALLTKAILDIELKKQIEEFEKAGILIKSVRVEDDGRIIESVSFEAFKYHDIVTQQWESSEFKERLERKFFFVFFKMQNGARVLQSTKFWNMPYQDIKEAKRLWIQTKKIVQQGNIVKKVDVNGKRETNFWGKEMNKVAHVRPHGQNKEDTFPLPVKDKVTKLKEYTKHSFWLNNNYVRDQIYLK